VRDDLRRAWSMVFKIRYNDPGVGGHVYCHLYAAPAPNQTYAQLGKFNVRRGDEFEALRSAMSGVAFEPWNTAPDAS
jgi:hypothetical protein